MQASSVTWMAHVRCQLRIGTVLGPWNYHQLGRRRQQPLAFPLPRPAGELRLSRGVVALSKQGERFFSSVATATSTGDGSAANRLIKKFVAASPKSIALDALSHLLSPNCTHPHLSSLALPLYLRISEASWFNWNSKLVANLVPFLDKQGQGDKSAALVSESIARLHHQERDLVLFFCNLIESYSKRNLSRGFDEFYDRLYQIVCDSNSFYVKEQGYKSMVSGLCEMGRPREAEELVEEIRKVGLKVSHFEFRCVLYGYGRLGLFLDMQRSLEQMVSEGFKVDTVCSNMILSSYGAHNALPDMVIWLQRMKDLGIPYSLRTYNSVLNSCPTIMSMMQGSIAYCVSVEELMKILSKYEKGLIEELIGSSVLDEAMKWDASEGKLDLHGMHLGSAYLIMLQWMKEVRSRMNDKKHAIPAEITVVCGSGNHSSTRGESPIKRMVKEIMVQSKSPLRIDRKNIGCFVAKGRVVKEWLCNLGHV